MKKFLFGMMALAAFAGGCGSDNKQSSRIPLNPAAIDIAPAPAYTAAPQPIQPVAVLQPVEQPASPAGFNTAASAGSSYTVQKGDTLYKIARERYGDAKQWQKIVAANPGLSPNSLKVGQKIAIP